MTHIFLDTETTGLGKKDRVLQLAFILRHNNKITAYETLCNPNCKINKSASKVHGIYKEDVCFEPHIEDTEAWKILNRHNTPDTICFAHNASFDMRMLLQSGFVNHMKIIDTLSYARHHTEHRQNNQLQTIRKQSSVQRYEKRIMERIGVDKISAHDALGDVISLMAYVSSIVKQDKLDALMKCEYIPK